MCIVQRDLKERRVEGGSLSGMFLEKSRVISYQSQEEVQPLQKLKGELGEGSL